MRARFLCLSALLGCARSEGAATPPPDLTGVWAVTMRYEDGSCPDVQGGSQASMWTVNRDGDGTYAVTVQGDEKVPTLTGREDGSDVTLVGLTEGYPSVSTQWRLRGAASELKGRALQTRLCPKAYKVKSRWGESEKDVMCTVIWTVDATKQGK